MGAARLNHFVGEQCLQRFLNRLLGVKPEDAV